MITFNKWILKFNGVDLPIGDLANDILNDHKFPELKSRQDIHKGFDYLKFKIGAGELELDVFVSSYVFYWNSQNSIDDTNCMRYANIYDYYKNYTYLGKF